MNTFKPTYNNCTDDRKEISWNICKHLKKDTIIICTLTKKECIAWKRYKHES